MPSVGVVAVTVTGDAGDAGVSDDVFGDGGGDRVEIWGTHIFFKRRVGAVTAPGPRLFAYEVL